MKPGILLALALAAVVPATAYAAPPLQLQVEAVFAAAPTGTRFGLLVVDEQGREVVAVAPDQRFLPASNTKLFTTAAAYTALPGMDQPDTAGGTRVALVPVRAESLMILPGVGPDDKVPAGPIDAWLIGRGDARMSSAPDCVSDCLSALADAVAAKTKRVRDVVGDDSFWPDQRWTPGMSWNNIGTDDGTAVGALNLDDNVVALTVTPGAEGQRPVVAMPDYFALRNEAVTTAPGGKPNLRLERAVNGMELRLYGEIPADAKQWRERVGLDDPAHFAAWVFKRMLEVRGVKVSGKVRVNHGPVSQWDDPRWRPGAATPEVIGAPPLAQLSPPPLAEDVVTINKQSSNLHAEALLRRVGDVQGTGSESWAVEALHAVLATAGLPRAGYDFSDGSGMSTYNRVSPRAAVGLLRWAKGQPWGASWRASLPVGGVDGTLWRRFGGTPLAGRLWAKTGTLNATNALSGYMTAASGRELTFSVFANDVPDGANAVPAIDAALTLIAAAN
ncbi:MAG: D-alanyl-D-alanine carboxypeptidase/D-alanyl-D-alanine-endopeptidase [Novosphingobium sp.]|uniref:D-alanyl-D-alanine carboxypeptidase/D-alanyl-D-alanine endopeptidase n=1 Tax=Novosphingobium sp. TaxID=1874826 RepID=UPI0032B6FCE7